MRFMTPPLEGNIRPLAFAIGLLMAVSACSTDKLLTVSDPAVAYPDQLNDANAIPNLYLGAVGDFQVAWSGNGLSDAFLPATGLFSDEFRSSDTFITRNDADRRMQSSPANGNLGDIAYTALHRARRSTEVSADVITRLGTAGDPRLAELQSLAGYTYLGFGEAFCSAVPFPSSLAPLSEIPTAASITTAQTFDTAAARFNAAVASLGTATTTTANSRRNLARVGLGRALLNQGKYAEAAAAVSSVPTIFVYKNEHSANTPRQENSLWNLNGSNRRYTVSDVEGINGLNYRAANDPRVPWFDQRRNGFDGATRLYEQLRYSSRDADVPVANGIEARLIQAEALLNAGSLTWLDTLNALRAQVGPLMSANFDNYVTNLANSAVTNTTLAPLVDPDLGAAGGPTTARVNLVFRERAFWLYATGHRLGDMRRLIRQYNRPANSVFPTGAWHKGGNYGDDVAMVIPFDEQNNAQYNPAACLTTQP